MIVYFWVWWQRITVFNILCHLFTIPLAAGLRLWGVVRTFLLPISCVITINTALSNCVPWSLVIILRHPQRAIQLAINFFVWWYRQWCLLSELLLAILKSDIPSLSNVYIPLILVAVWRFQRVRGGNVDLVPQMSQTGCGPVLQS